MKKKYTEEDLIGARRKGRDEAFQQRDDAMKEVENREARIKKNTDFVQDIVLEMLQAAHLKRGQIMHEGLLKSGDSRPIVFYPLCAGECQAAFDVIKKYFDDGKLQVHLTSAEELR